MLALTGRRQYLASVLLRNEPDRLGLTREDILAQLAFLSDEQYLVPQRVRILDIGEDRLAYADAIIEQTSSLTAIARDVTLAPQFELSGDQLETARQALRATREALRANLREHLKR